MTDLADLGPEVITGEVVEGIPGRKELILAGRAALAELGADPDDFVDERAEEQLRRATPENTVDLMRWAFGFLVRYCGETGRRHDPPTVGTIRQMICDAFYMVDAAGRGRGRYGRPYAPNTVATVVYCLSMIFDRLQWKNPCRHPKIADQLKGYQGDYERAGHRTDESDALTEEQSVAIARSYDLGTVQGLRNAAMLRGQFDLGCRADEWCKVSGGDLVWLDEDRVLIEFIGSNVKGGKKRTVSMQAVRELTIKKDGAEVVVPHPNADVDPCLLLARYIKARIAGGWDGTGPLWVEVHRGDRRKDYDETGILGGRFLPGTAMSYTAYAAAFARVIRLLKLDIDPVTKKRNRHYTTHSNRIGMIDAAFKLGMRLEDVAARTGHSPRSKVIADYLRLAPTWGDANPGVLIRMFGGGGNR